MKFAWVSTWDKVCGIADYSKVLFPLVEKELMRLGHTLDLVKLEELRPMKKVLDRIHDIRPDLIHFQHEYGIYGGKNPPFYYFPSLVHTVRSLLPDAVQIATAHTVLGIDYKYPLKGKGAQVPARVFANAFLVGGLRRLWGQQTFGRMNTVLVHSQFQAGPLEAQSRAHVDVVPHFVQVQMGTPPLLSGETQKKRIVVFGFVTPEKGQDIAIEALNDLPKHYSLVIAGGPRKKTDDRYYAKCLKQIDDLGLSDRVIVTGYIDPQSIDRVFAQADLVLAPFKETSGSGSLAQALGRSQPILASDLPLNLEIAEREPGALAFFKSEDPKDCAAQILDLVEHPEKRQALSEAAGRYAAANAPEKVAARIVEIYLKQFK